MTKHNPWAPECRQRDDRTPMPGATCRRCRKPVK